jgi:hypothetical protein
MNSVGTGLYCPPPSQAEIDALLQSFDDLDSYAGPPRKSDLEPGPHRAIINQILADVAARKAARNGFKAANDDTGPVVEFPPAAESGPLVEVDTPPALSTPPSPRPLPRWDRLKPVDALATHFAALDTFGVPVAFTLRFSPDVIRALNDNHGKGTGDGFATKALNKITTQLRKLGVEVVLPAVDVSPAGHLHVHGGLALKIANDNARHEVERILAIEDRDRRRAEIEANPFLRPLRTALERAGGKWASKHGRKHQVDLRDLPDPAGWASYCLKDSTKVRRLIKGKVVAITRPLNTAAKELHEERRARLDLLLPPELELVPEATLGGPLSAVPDQFLEGLRPRHPALPLDCECHRATPVRHGQYTQRADVRESFRRTRSHVVAAAQPALITAADLPAAMTAPTRIQSRQSALTYRSRGPPEFGIAEAGTILKNGHDPPPMSGHAQRVSSVFQTTITPAEFADINDHLAVTSCTDDGALMTTTGKHPDLGAVVIVQGIPALTMISEHSYVRFIESGDAR